jgi:hypothetical protein
MLPTVGFSDQVRAVVGAPETVAVNAWVCEGVRLMLTGLTDIGGVTAKLALTPAVMPGPLHPI